MTTLFIAVLIIFITGLTLHKVRRVHLFCFRLQDEFIKIRQGMSTSEQVESEINGLYNQFQSYLDLTQLIRPAQPLPMLRGWAASPDFLLQISRHALGQKPSAILECSSGSTTLVLARCCQLNGTGHVYSLEHDAVYAHKTRQGLVSQGLQDWATVIDAPLAPQPGVGGQVWYSLDHLALEPGSFSLLVIDGPPWNTAPLARYPAVPMLQTYLAAKCSVFLDDAARPDEQEAVKRWLATYPEFNLTWPDCEKGCAKLTRGEADAF